jgi:hypothetical protein
MVALRNIQPPKHSGKYKIEATNAVGTATHSVMVTGESWSSAIARMKC